MSDDFLAEIRTISKHLRENNIELRQIKERLPSHRQLFSALILQSLILGTINMAPDERTRLHGILEKSAVRMADTLIEELKRDPHK